MRIVPGERRRPGFLVVGEKRCGTTSLHRYLRAHPQVSGAASAKSAHFFDLNYGRGLDWYERFFTPEPIARLQERRSGPQICGETSPYYLYHPAVPERISNSLGDVKILVLVREPALRAWSHYQYEKAKGTETLEFADALAAEPERLQGESERLLRDPGYVSDAHRAFSYLDRSRYARSLERYLAHFSAEQIHVVQSERLFADPHGELARIHNFLEIASFETPNLKPGRANKQTNVDQRALEGVREVLFADTERFYELVGERFWD